MKKKDKKIKKAIPKIKKDLKKFLLSEEGKMTKKNILKGAMTVTTAALLADSAVAQHSNTFHNSGGTGSHTSHASHGSHASHSRGGWC